MTICNMSIEGGARAGMIAPDQTTFDYLKGRPHAPVGEDWDAAVEYWSSLRTDPDAVFDTEVVLQAEDIEPFVTWGTNPGQGLPLSARVPDPRTSPTPPSGWPPNGPWSTWTSYRERPARHQGRHRLHRFVHQRPYRGPAGRRRGGAWAQEG